MKEYIDREALIAEYDRVHQGPAGGARKLMVDAPAADVVEVVRCKDCKFWDECFNDPITSYQYGFCNSDKWRDVEGWEQETNGQDFCSYGERKEQK